MKRLIKKCFQAFSLILAFPMAILSGFGRSETVYRWFAHLAALLPGIPGDYLRVAYYRMTLEGCSTESRIEFGSFLPHPQARIGKLVYIGCYCILGRTVIGDRTQISSGVQILSGRHQHSRDEQGGILGADEDAFCSVTIGPDCWIGAGAIVMDDVGAGSTIGAGSVVTKPVPAGSVAAGNPARILKSAIGSPQ